MQYTSYVLRNTGRQVFAVYDNIENAPICKKDRSPYSTTDQRKADRLAMSLNNAKDAASIASALIAFGASQSDAWRYAQTKYAL